MALEVVITRSSIPKEAALVHDYLLVLRGAERTFAAMTDLFPGAPIYTSLYSKEGTDGRFASHPVSLSWLRRLPVGQRRFRMLLPLYPGAMERLPVASHDLVISSSSAFALGVRPGPDAVHVCYCHTPFRYAWHERERALAGLPRVARPAARRVLDRIREWDLQASRRVTVFVANSAVTRDRINRTYGRDATVVHPPVEVERFSPATPDRHLLVVGELVAHKRVDVALEAARLARLPVKVVGEGPELERLRAGYPAAEFVGRVGDQELAALYSRSLALIVANVEEFGIAAVEAQASGRPVVAIASGGAIETVVDGETGFLVDGGTARDLAEALDEDALLRLDSDRIVRHAESFSTKRFGRELIEAIEQARG